MNQYYYIEEDAIKTMFFVFGLVGVCATVAHSIYWLGLTAWMWTLVDLFNRWANGGYGCE